MAVLSRIYWQLPKTANTLSQHIRQWYLWKVFSGNQKLVGSCHFIDTSCINLEFSLGTLWGSKLWVRGKMQLLLSYDRTLCEGKDIYQSDPAQVPKYFLWLKWLCKGYLTNCWIRKHVFICITETHIAWAFINAHKYDLGELQNTLISTLMHKFQNS